MKKLFLLSIFALLGIYAINAQENRSSKSEMAAIAIDFSKIVENSNAVNLIFLSDGMKNEEGSAGEFLSKKIEVPIKNAEEFFTLAAVWEALNYTDDGIIIQYKTSIDGSSWGNWGEFKIDEHSGAKDDENNLVENKYISELFFLDKTIKFIQYQVIFKKNCKTIIKSIRFDFFSPGNDQAGLNKSGIQNPPAPSSLACPCPQPAFKTRTQWGCPAGQGPTGQLTNVTHLVVHHSASSNTSSNWSNTVLSIWNYAVNSLGYTDMHYNWLIDPNGVLYQGRAWNGNNSNVLGAHMCGCNGGKMGVCMIGDFTNSPPTTAAYNKLVELLAWKCCAINISPTGSSTGSGKACCPNSCSCSTFSINKIIGHKSGCGNCTQCPGNSFFPLIPTLRTDVQTFINSCGSGCASPSPATVSGGGTYCNSAILTASGGSGGTIYWQGTTSGGTSIADFTNPKTVTASGTYYFRAHNSCGWGSQGSVVVNIDNTTCGGNTPPTNLSVSPPTCNNPNATFNWSNNSNNWNLDVTTNSNWSSWDVKFGLIGTSETGPAGFSGGLTFQAGLTYYWRIYNGSTFTYGPSFTVPNCDPLGYLDIADCASIQGWTYDPDYSGLSIDVHIYIDGLFATALTTTAARPDVNTMFNISGVHGYSWNLPTSFQDGSAHLVQVYAINVPSGNNPLIGTENFGPCIPVNLQSSSNSICENDNILLSWTNSGSGWYIDISTSPTFASYSNQAIPNVTSANASAGFSPAFTFQPDTIYYWRIWNGNGVHTVAPLSITVNPTPSAAAITVSDDSICPGFSTTIAASGSVGGTVDYNYYDAPSAGTLLGQNSITVTPPASSTYYLELINQFGCKSIPNPTAIPIIVNPAPSTPTVIANPDAVCLGDTALISASGSTGGIVFYNFYDSLNAGLLVGPSPLSASPSTNTVYYLEAINQYGCVADTGRVPVLLTINPLPADPVFVSGDISICFNDSTLLVGASPNAAITWWSSANAGIPLVSNDTFATPALFSSQIYYIQAQSPEGCLNPGGRIPIYVTVNPLPILTLSNDAVTFNSIFEGQIIVFTASPEGLVNYLFFLDSIPIQTGNNNIYSTNFIKDQQTVAVIATDINGCKNLYDNSIRIEVKPRSNAFTPNGDGINELFLNGLDITIVNRWGMVLFEGKNGWNGQHNGKDLPDGTYFYIIKLYNLASEITQISGPVTLTR